jgi:hypothetical protein
MSALESGKAAAKDALNAATGTFSPWWGSAFRRLATFPVYLNTDIASETVAEIVAATDDGMTLIYTDGASEQVGYVDISDPSRPQAAGVTRVAGEPTSLAVAGDYALVAVNTSTSYTAPSGQLSVVEIASQALVADIDLGGQPDAVAVSPDGRYAAVAIENERDEDLGDGAPPQLPAGRLVIVDLIGPPDAWDIRAVSLTGLAERFPDDPEPEYVDINRDNLAVVTLQENNHVVLVDLASGEVVGDFSAGRVDLDGIDTAEDELIDLTGSLTGVPREPDGVVWLPDGRFATADEGDLDGGGRGFTIFNRDGSVSYAAGNSVEHAIVRVGHFPEQRASKKGNEPENVTAAIFAGHDLLFVGSERASVVLVYRLSRHWHRPYLIQVLAAPKKPEGLMAIPSRSLLVAAGEEDARDDKIRAGLTIYRFGDTPNYPTIVSTGYRPIPWGALSGLTVAPRNDRVAYTVHDSFYRNSRIFELRLSTTPARLTGDIVLRDTRGLLAAVDASLINDDATVNLDLEGIAARHGGGFWLVSEGSGTVGDSDHPVRSLNLLLRVGRRGSIEEVATLPEAVNARQVRFGFEGVAVTGRGDDEVLTVAFQRAWLGDPMDHARIARFTPATGTWRFFYYPLTPASSPNGGWVGVSDIVASGPEDFVVIERDNQAGPDATIKQLQRFSTAGLRPLADDGSVAPAFPVLNKTLLRDLLPDLQATGGMVLEKLDGLALTGDGDALLVNDNDGLDGTNGETQLLRLPGLLALP